MLSAHLIGQPSGFVFSVSLRYKGNHCIITSNQIKSKQTIIQITKQFYLWNAQAFQLDSDFSEISIGSANLLHIHIHYGLGEESSLRIEYAAHCSACPDALTKRMCVRQCVCCMVARFTLRAISKRSSLGLGNWQVSLAKVNSIAVFPIEIRRIQWDCLYCITCIVCMSFCYPMAGV